MGYTSAVFAQRQQYRILGQELIFFGSNSEKIKSQYTRTLKEIAALLHQFPNRKAWIQAHADSLGSYEFNQQLSDKRAASVYNFLLKEGVEGTQLKINSYGEYLPFKNNKTSDGRALNRRVTIEVVEPYIPKEIEETHCTIWGKVVNAQTQKTLPTQIVLQFLGKQDTIFTDSTGQYFYTTALEIEVAVSAYAKGYFFVSKRVATQKGQQKQVNFSLEKAVVGKKMTLSDLFFQSGTALLMPTSERALDGLVSFMQFNETINVEIGGHINKPNQAPVLPNSSSFKLSEARAAFVYHYLLDKGIEAQRLTYKGYGNAEMIYPRATNPIEEQANRRVELTVIAE